MESPAGLFVRGQTEQSLFMEDESINLSGTSNETIDQSMLDSASETEVDNENWIHYYASPKLYHPFELLAIPWEARWKLNLEYRGLPPGELEADRRKCARRITSLVDYKRKEGDEERVFFYTQGERFGGPYGVFSNHHLCNFRVPEIHPTHLFTSMEQCYQYCKAKTMALQPVRYSSWGAKNLDTGTLHEFILKLDNPNHCAEAGRCFNYLEKQDPEWWNQWYNNTWKPTIPKILQQGLDAKFTQNPELSELLIMTGDFQLVKAAEGDFSCGIGYHAAGAREMEEHWGENLMGKALENTREKMRGELQITNRSYAFKFWRLYEETCNYERYLQLQDSGAPNVKLPEERVSRRELDRQMKRYKEDWMAAGRVVEDEGIVV